MTGQGKNREIYVFFKFEIGFDLLLPCMARKCPGIITIIVVISKDKVHPITGHESPEGEMYSCTLSLTSALDWGGWSKPRPGRFIPGK